MVRCVCAPLFFLLLSGTVHADLLLSTTEESYVFPTSTPSPEETYTPVPDVTTAPPGAEILPSENPSGLTNITTVAPTASLTIVTTPTTNVTTVIPASDATVSPASDATVSPASDATVSPASDATVSPASDATVSPASDATVSPASNVTTVSTPAPTTTPLPEPFIGNYNVSDNPGLICLKARMGLQFSFRSPQGANFESVNIDPNAMTISGTCGSNSTNSTLVLTSDKVTVQFIFSNTANKFHLSGLNFSVNIGSGNTFSDQNHSLSLWEASLGNSYMCRREQSFNVTSNLTLNTFELQVQPFGVSNNKFSTAHECSLDDTSVLIPIIVGAALAVLILIVVIAYVIGRRKTYVGYQTL